MGLNDEREKLRQAKAWLTDCEVSSQNFQASCDYVEWLLRNAQDPVLYAEAQKLMDQATERMAA